MNYEKLTKAELISRIKSLESSVENAEHKKAEDEIKGLAKFPSENPNPVMRVFKDGNILYHNKASAPLLDLWDCQTTKILPENYIKIASDVLHSGLSSVAETECCEDRVISLTFAPVTEEDYVNIYGMDITERKKAEENIKTINESLEQRVVERTGKLKEKYIEHLNEIIKREQAEEHNKVILRTALDGFWILDIQGRILEVNDAYCNLTGYSREKLLEMCVSDVEALEKPEDTKKHIQQIIKSGSGRFESKHRCKDGRIIYIEVSTNYLNIKGGRFFSFIRDITERKQTEKEARRSKLLLEAFVENSPAVIFIKDLKGRIIRINRAFEDLLGISRENLLGKTDYDLYPTSKITAKRMRANDRMVLEAGKPMTIEEVPKVHGEDRYYITVKFPIRNEQGEITSIAGIATDITERKKMESELQESNELKRQLIESSFDCIKILDLQGNLLFMNNGGKKALEIDDIEPYLNKSWLDYWEGEDKKAAFGAISNAVNEEIGSFQGYCPTEKGKPKWWDVVLSPILGDGNVERLLCISRDITDHKRAEDELRESEERYRAVAEDMPVLICRFLPGGEITYVNKAYCQYFQKTPEELVGHSFLLLIPEADHEVVMASIDEITADSPTQSQEHQVVGPGGKIRWQRWTNRALFDAYGKAVAYQSIGEDITDHKKAEEELRQYGHIVSCSTDLMALLNKSFIYLAVNQAYLEAFKKTRKEVIEHTPSEVFGEEFFNTVIKSNAESVLAGEEVNYQAWFNFPAHERRYMDITYYPYFDENKNVVGFVVNGRNITERKKAEKMLLEQKKVLEKKNIALNEILGQIEIEKKQIKDNVVANAENLLLPIIQKLKLTGESRKYVQLLQNNLQELTSSFGTRLTGKKSKLTSREIEICNLIKNGLTSKEITSILNISQGTTERHRANIRRKLGVIKQDINLSSFLKTL